MHFVLWSLLQAVLQVRSACSVARCLSTLVCIYSRLHFCRLASGRFTRPTFASSFADILPSTVPRCHAQTLTCIF